MESDYLAILGRSIYFAKKTGNRDFGTRLAVFLESAYFGEKNEKRKLFEQSKNKANPKMRNLSQHSEVKEMSDESQTSINYIWLPLSLLAHSRSRDRTKTTKRRGRIFPGKCLLFRKNGKVCDFGKKWK